jgi:hypothetical protein
MVIGGTKQVSCEIFDINTIMECAASLSSVPCNMSAVTYNGRVYLLGGQTGLVPPTRSCEMYEEGGNSGIGRWVSIAAMPSSRMGSSTVIVGNTVLVLVMVLQVRPVTFVVQSKSTPSTNTRRTLSWKLPFAMSSFGAVYHVPTRIIINEYSP